MLPNVSLLEEVLEGCQNGIDMQASSGQLVIGQKIGQANRKLWEGPGCRDR
jgi:hypothetical protein